MVRVFSERVKFPKRESETDEQWFNWYVQIESEYNPKKKDYLDMLKRVRPQQKEFLEGIKKDIR